MVRGNFSSLYDESECPNFPYSPIQSFVLQPPKNTQLTTGTSNRNPQRYPTRPHTHTCTHTHTHTRTHTLKNNETRTGQEKRLRNMCKPCPGGLFQPSAGLTCGKQQADNSKQTTGAWCSGPTATWVYQVISLHQRAPWCAVSLSSLTSTGGRPLHQGSSHTTAGLTGQHRSVPVQARDVCIHVLDAAIQPRRNKGTVSECLSVGAQSFTYRINGLHHRAPT